MSQFLRKFLIFRLNHKGQHVMEYAMILTAIIAAIIVMRPYVLRSWNAHVKGWEDSVYDSYHDRLIDAPEDSIRIEGCNCNWEDRECGATSGPTTRPPRRTCGELERLQIKVCFPQGCENSPLNLQDTANCDPRPIEPCCVTQISPRNAPFNPQVHCGVNAGCGDCEIKLERQCSDPRLEIAQPPWCSADIPNDIASSSVQGNQICCFECTGANNIECATRQSGVQAQLNHQSCETVGFCPGTTGALTHDTPVRTIASDDS